MHELDLGGAAAPADAAAAAEDHVLHRLAADRERRLLAHRPQHRVGDVGLARAVGPDDHAHAGREVEPRAVGEGLEALQGDRLQVHGEPPRSRGLIALQRLERARRLLLGVLLRAPRAAPATSAPATVAVTSKVRSCGGPRSAVTS